MTLSRISPLAIPLDDAAINFPSADGVNARALGAGVAESMTIPSGANLVRLVGTADFYMLANGTATVPGDTTDGTASELVKYQGGDETWRHLSGVTSLSVISAATCIVTATFYIL